MITDAELQRMRDDAERIQALREKATKGPWVFDEMGDWSIRTPPNEQGFAEDIVSNQDGCLEPISTAENGRFIAASRTNQSATDVLLLAEDFERLREITLQHVPKPTEYQLFHIECWRERHSTKYRGAMAHEIINACYVHDVPVPEHLKVYENVEQ